MTHDPTHGRPTDPDIQLARDLVAAAAHVLVTTHRHPDGDAVGSVLAMARALRQAGKETTAHTPDPPPPFLRFLPDLATIRQAPGPVPDYDLIIALDHSELSRTGLEAEILEARRPVLAIDHHTTADQKASIRFVVPDAAATCELLAELLPAFGLSVDAGTATCLLTGIVTDTGSFQHANTSARALRAAADLLTKGADLRAIVAGVYGSKPLAALRIMGRVLERLHANPTTGAAVSFVTHEDLVACGARPDDLTGVVNLLNTIPETSYSLLLTEYEAGKVKGSLRSLPDKAVDVAAIAKHLGGGGHTLASGFEVAGRLVRDATGWRIE
jgi:phosphoesterase RecJ-like protein